MSCTSQASIHTPHMGPLLGFTGQPRDPFTGCYHLGNGHRTYNPVLMRFHSADRLSPFGKGGLNAYAYCQGDPVNYQDPSGQVPVWLAPVKSILSNAISLGLNVVKIAHNQMVRRYLRLDTGHAGSRDGELTFGTPESAIPKWTKRDIVTTVVGTVASLAGMGIGGARAAGINSDALAWTEFAFLLASGTAGLSHLAEMAWKGPGVRYPITAVGMRDIRA